MKNSIIDYFLSPWKPIIFFLGAFVLTIVVSKSEFWCGIGVVKENMTVISVFYYLTKFFQFSILGAGIIQLTQKKFKGAFYNLGFYFLLMFLGYYVSAHHIGPYYK